MRSENEQNNDIYIRNDFKTDLYYKCPEFSLDSTTSTPCYPIPSPHAEENNNIYNSRYEASSNHFSIVNLSINKLTNNNETKGAKHNSMIRRKRQRTVFNDWTAKSDDLLTNLCNSSIGSEWTSISKMIGSKTPGQCICRRNKFKRLSKANNSRIGIFKKGVENTDNPINTFLRGSKSSRYRLLTLGSRRNVLNGNKSEKNFNENLQTLADDVEKGIYQVDSECPDFSDKNNDIYIPMSDSLETLYETQESPNSNKIFSAFSDSVRQINEPQKSKRDYLNLGTTNILDSKMRLNSFENYINRAYRNKFFEDVSLGSNYTDLSNNNAADFKIWFEKSFCGSKLEANTAEEPELFITGCKYYSNENFVNLFIKEAKSFLDKKDFGEVDYEKLSGYLVQLNENLQKATDCSVRSELLKLQVGVIEKMMFLINNKLTTEFF
jgi:hypothetical protein